MSMLRATCWSRKSELSESVEGLAAECQEGAIWVQRGGLLFPRVSDDADGHSKLKQEGSSQQFSK